VDLEVGVGETCVEDALGRLAVGVEHGNDPHPLWGSVPRHCRGPEVGFDAVDIHHPGFDRLDKVGEYSSLAQDDVLGRGLLEIRVGSEGCEV
jgi:hypothetical protein